MQQKGCRENVKEVGLIDFLQEFHVRHLLIPEELFKDNSFDKVQ